MLSRRKMDLFHVRYAYFFKLHRHKTSVCVCMYTCVYVFLCIYVCVYTILIYAFLCMLACILYIDNVSLFVCLHVCIYVLYMHMSMLVECMHTWSMGQGRRLYRRYLCYITHPHWSILCY